MGLTVAEKEHWKRRIERRLDGRIEAIYAEEPNLKERVQREARQRALDSLNLAGYQAELDAIERQQGELERREKQVRRAMLAHLRGVPASEMDDYTVYRHDSELEDAVRRRQDVHERELLAENQRGQEILRLEEEKDNLLDTVWLATSPREVKDLWSKVAELLGSDQTPLEREALAIQPPAEA